MPIRRRAIVVAVLTVALTAASAWAATPVKVIDAGNVIERDPSAADGWLGWTANTVASPNRYGGYVRPTGGAVTKIRHKGDVVLEEIVVGGPHEGEVLFWTNDTGDGDLKFYDLDTGAITNAPAGVNTAKRESTASASGDYLAFGRHTSRSTYDIFLYRFSTGRLKKIVPGWFFVTQLNGNYLAYMRCVTRTCDAWRYSIAKDRSIKMPEAPEGRANYYPAVLADGSMFWVQGNNDLCGKNTKIVRRSSTGNITTIWNAPDGTEIADLEAKIVGGSPVLMIAERNCATEDLGVYRIDL
jgi:hypothetical protein